MSLGIIIHACGSVVTMPVEIYIYDKGVHVCLSENNGKARPSSNIGMGRARKLSSQS
jgi:hypothetical protein